GAHRQNMMSGTEKIVLVTGGESVFAEEREREAGRLDAEGDAELRQPRGGRRIHASLAGHERALLQVPQLEASRRLQRQGGRERRREVERESAAIRRGRRDEKVAEVGDEVGYVAQRRVEHRLDERAERNATPSLYAEKLGASGELRARAVVAQNAERSGH